MTGRREFLKVAAGASLGTIMPAQAQSPSLPASPLTRPADLVLTNGKIITVDRDFTHCAGDRRSPATGSSRSVRDAAMAALIAPATRIVDLKGRAVIPGLVDGHAHMDREGLKSDLSGARARSLDPRHPGSHRRARAQQAARRVDRDHADRRSAVSISTCRTSLPRSAGRPGRSSMPRRPNNPVFIRSIWGFWRAHAAARLLRQHRGACGAPASRRDTVSPVDTLTIEKDANGDPTGVFIEQDMQPTRRADLVPQRDRVQSRRSRPHVAAVGAGLPRLRHDQRVRGAWRRDRS